MSIDRRNFLKTLGVAGVGLTVGKNCLHGSVAKVSEHELMSVLVDTTRCIGCQSCEYACAETYGNPDPEDYPEVGVKREPSEIWRTVVNAYHTGKGEYFAKKQCMHCNQPACDAACLTQAMHKTETGPVEWRGDKCMGCRFCMISCPYDIPKFEYLSANPKINKCTLCSERLQDGELPACVEACPAEALMFGTREDMLFEARRRIHDDPDLYQDHIYGEHEAGGSSWLYLSAVPFEELGFNTKIRNESYPKLTKGFISSIAPVDILLPAALLGIYEASKSKDEEDSL